MIPVHQLSVEGGLDFLLAGDIGVHRSRVWNLSPGGIGLAAA